MSDKKTIEKAIFLARDWQRKIQETPTLLKENKLHHQVNAMLKNSKEKYCMMELLDQSFRTENFGRVKAQMLFIFKKYGLPKFLSFKEKCLVRLFFVIGKYIPNISVPLFIKQVMKSTEQTVLSADSEKLKNHLKKRKKEKTSVNLNLIGEVVLGEKEANQRIQQYLKALQHPDINYISIKISTMYSQIHVLDFGGTVKIVSERLALIYREAMRNTFVDDSGQKSYKFINLDMEEYRDLEMTVQVFMQTLERPEFHFLKAGIVLQAYLPDSFAYQKRLIQWAKKRIQNGGVPIKIRLVKGANKEMEETESSLKHWQLATYNQKIDTDAHYKKMLEYAFIPENAKAVQMGIASHNLFELAYAYVYAEKQNTLEYLTFEMLEGMCENAYQIIKKNRNVVLYAPAATKENFTSAIAYLFRRLDENTAPENFMRHIFGLKVNSPDWQKLEKSFLKSFEKKDFLKNSPNRTQNRLEENFTELQDLNTYIPESDTDFTLSQNRIWAENIKNKWQKNTDFIIPVVFAGENFTKNKQQKSIKDKNQDFLEIGKYCVADKADIKKALEIAEKDPDKWREKTILERSKMMANVANIFRNKRADLIGVAAMEVGKIFTETDVEVSEAVDFVNFYAHSALKFEKDFPNLKMQGKGVGLVVPPWNFPIAIPVGGIASALAAGNTVIIKPSSNAVACAYELCKCFWEGGISKNTLQFLPCSGAVAGENLIPSEKIDFVILTGGEDTAYKMLAKRPNLFLTAETGGKNAMIVTNVADKEKAILDIVQSAFFNSGQKCSACSLLVLEKDVYEDTKFKEMLVDAAKSLKVGSVWNFENKLSTLANPISDTLRKALTHLETGEEWALSPKIKNDYLIHPCIKYGVKQGNFTFRTELFAPVLSVVCADDLKHAVKMVNTTGYGLTSGLHSLDEREMAYWKKNIKAGNLYINRTTTGAIVLRQPFGGMGKSAIGTGRKVGIYNYITQFMNYEEQNFPKVKPFKNEILERLENFDKTIFEKEIKQLKNVLFSYQKNYENEFSKEKDYANIRGEDNHFRYLPVKKILFFVSEKEDLFEIGSRIIACKIIGITFKISIKNEENNTAIKALLKHKLLTKNNFIFERQNNILPQIKNYNRVFFGSKTKILEETYKTAHEFNIPIIKTKPLMEGRLELLHYFLEQSITNSYHRHGNLGSRIWQAKKHF